MLLSRWSKIPFKSRILKDIPYLHLNRLFPQVFSRTFTVLNHGFWPRLKIKSKDKICSWVECLDCKWSLSIFLAFVKIYLIITKARTITNHYCETKIISRQNIIIKELIHNQIGAFSCIQKYNKLAINSGRKMQPGNIFSHLCFVYHYVARNFDMLEKTKQNTLLLSLVSIITILLIFVSNNNMIREVKINIFQPYQQSQNNKSYLNLTNISRRTEIQLTSQNNCNCSQEWISFIVPYRNRKEHLPLFLKALTNHEKLNSKQNVSDSKVQC